MKKVAAFTILELTIAMLVSAVVIGITYTAFLIVSKSYNAFDDKNDEMATVLALNELLKKDFLRSEKIEKDTSGIIFHYPARIIKYRFDTAFIVRIAGRTDTFKIKADTVSSLYEGESVQLSSDSPENNRIDELILPVTLQKQKFTYHYHKVYSSENLINRMPDAIH